MNKDRRYVGQVMLELDLEAGEARREGGKLSRSPSWRGRPPPSLSQLIETLVPKFVATASSSDIVVGDSDSCTFGAGQARMPLIDDGFEALLEPFYNGKKLTDPVSAKEDKFQLLPAFLKVKGKCFSFLLHKAFAKSRLGRPV